MQSLYGDCAIFYITIFNMPFNILFYMIALDLFRKDAIIGAGNCRKEKLSVKKFFHPGVLSSAAALVIYFAQIPLPVLFFDCVGFVGAITTPLSMIIIGASLAAVSVKTIWKEKAVLAMLPIRLAVMPLLVWGFMHLVTNDPVLIGICTVGAGMPVASLVGMASIPYERQNRCASIGIAASSIVSLLTIPVMAVLLKAG